MCAAVSVMEVPRYPRTIVGRSIILAASLSLSLACAKPVPNRGPADESAPTQPAAAPPTGAHAAVVPTAAATARAEPTALAEPTSPVEPVEIESAELEWAESPLQADLDGDGAPESIRWTCARDLRITVGRAKAREAYHVADLIGCSAAVVALRPGEPTRQVVFTIDEHDEAGPDRHFLYAYRGAKLERLWSDAASVDFLVDGSWSTETIDCDDDAGHSTTTTRRYRWDGVKVASEQQQQRIAVEPGACAEP